MLCSQAQVYQDVQQRMGSNRGHAFEGCSAKTGGMEGGQKVELKGADPELCSLECRV